LLPSSEEEKEKKEDTDAIVAATAAPAAHVAVLASPGPHVVGIQPYYAIFAATAVARGTVLAVPVVSPTTVRVVLLLVVPQGGG
jgi:aspartate/methionine/tyrosine aminotransferase